MPDERTSLRRTRKWPAWSGSGDELDRLIREIHKHTESRRHSRLLQLDEQIENTVDDFTRRTLQRERAEVDDKSQLGMALQDTSDLTVMGAATDIRPQIDPRTVTNIELYAFFDQITEYDRIILKLRRTEYLGVSLFVISPDPAWTRSVFSSMSEEIEKGVRRWAHLRLPMWRAILSGLVFVALSLTGALVINGIADTAPYLGKLTGGMAVGLTGIGALANDRVYNWFFPQFELVKGQSTGSRRLTLLLTVLLSIPLGILVNILSPS